MGISLGNQNQWESVLSLRNHYTIRINDHSGFPPDEKYLSGKIHVPYFLLKIPRHSCFKKFYNEFEWVLYYKLGWLHHSRPLRLSMQNSYTTQMCSSHGLNSNSYSTPVFFYFSNTKHVQVFNSSFLLSHLNRQCKCHKMFLLLLGPCMRDRGPWPVVSA